MPTHGPVCDFCGQHRQAEEDLREAMMALLLSINSLELWGIDDNGTLDPAPRIVSTRCRALLARLDERYPK